MVIRASFCKDDYQDLVEIISKNFLMKDSKIKLSVIVLLYHGDRWIDICVSSLEDQSLQRDTYEILLVDNGGSTPSSKRYENRNHVRVIHFPENYGFADGNNRALTCASGDLVLLMNQDVMVHYNCLQELVSAFGRYPGAGVLSANMRMVSEKDVLYTHEEISDVVGFYRLSRFGYASYLLARSDKDIIPVDFVSGNALCFQKAMIGNIGGYLFDSSLVSYMEDLDLSIRLKMAGRKMYVLPSALVYHFRDNAFSGSPMARLDKFIHISGNRLVVYFNNLDVKIFIKKLPALSIGIPLKVSNPDGKGPFNYLMFLVALLVSPLVFLDFFLKITARKRKRVKGEAIRFRDN